SPVISTADPCGPCDPCKVYDPCKGCNSCKGSDPCDPCKKRKGWLQRFWSREKCKPGKCEEGVASGTTAGHEKSAGRYDPRLSPTNPGRKTSQEPRPVVKAPLTAPQPRDFRESWGKVESSKLDSARVAPNSSAETPVARTPGALEGPEGGMLPSRP